MIGMLTALGLTNSIKAQDWPNFAQFQDANAALEVPAENEDRVVFMGNSITENWSHYQPEFFKNESYINRGIGGQTTPQILMRFKQDVVELQPKVVVICAGTNDIAENTGPTTLKMIADNIAEMAEIAKKNHINVIIASVHPAFDYPWRKGLSPDKKIPALNTLLQRYAKKNNIIYLDYFKAMHDGNNGLLKKYTYDGVHPNKKGYEIMAPLAEAAIAEALK